MDGANKVVGRSPMSRLLSRLKMKDDVEAQLIDEKSPGGSAPVSLLWSREILTSGTEAIDPDVPNKSKSEGTLPEMALFAKLIFNL